ncbi:MAG: pyrrolysine--tRNA(Pyl) ligase large subunit [Candidatus Omnitrophota bacterium]
MNITWSEIQMRRLNELEAASDERNRQFESTEERDQSFHALEKKLVTHARRKLIEMRYTSRRPARCRMESLLVDALNAKGFVQVATPTLMSKSHLAKMTIDESHPLFNDIYWVSNDKCLRPMLAPHLYYVLKDLMRIWEKPVRIFEIGSCFRKESKGARHSTEFTMLNLVEMGLPQAECQTRVAQMASWVMNAVGISEYHFETEDSAVYGTTVDVVAGDENLEVGSAAMGPHALDIPWGITDAWAGIGFGLERLMMVKEKTTNISKFGRSLSYLDGIRLNI